MGCERTEFRWPRVNFDDWYAARPRQMRKARRRLDDPGGADDEDEVGVAAYLDGVGELAFGQGLVEPHDAGTDLTEGAVQAGVWLDPFGATDSSPTSRFYRLPLVAR